MASIDLRGVLASIDIRSAELVKFGNLCGAPTPTTCSYLTPSGNRVVLGGELAEGIVGDAILERIPRIRWSDFELRRCTRRRSTRT